MGTRILKQIFFSIFLVVFFGCAAPLKTDTVSFKLPSSYQNSKSIDGLNIALIPIDSISESERIFGTDLKTSNILPVQLVLKNSGVKEFEINHQQIFGITPNEELTVAYNLNKTAEHVRSSSIGTTAATHALAGAIAGAAVGAGLGAAIGSASGDSGSGAATGAAIGGAVGGTTGAGEGLSDSITLQFKKELANLFFGDRVIFQGDIQQGFIYLKWKNYNQIRMNVFNITENKMHELIFKVSLNR
ncbi:MAG: hypothetical protein ACE5ER_11750 [Nitrospinaceae bacterium]